VSHGRGLQQRVIIGEWESLPSISRVEPGKENAMFDVFAVTLRELAEVMLILGALSATVRSAGRAPLMRAAWWGLVAGALPALWAGVYVLDARMGPVAEGTLACAMALGTLSVATGMCASVSHLRGRVERLIEPWLDHPSSGVALMLFMAFVAFRETLEIAVFTRSIVAESHAGEVVTGLLLALAAGYLLVVAWRWLRVRTGMLAAFRLSALLLCMLSVQLLLHGIAVLNKAPVWGAAGAHFRDWIALFLEGGPFYGWVFAALMALPVRWHLRAWWMHADADVRR
tara:strand:+ start:226 stop:1080 length:855 start_codon:yes stop_codon:yes gene_type:complete